jgi:hypothetical protein
MQTLVTITFIQEECQVVACKQYDAYTLSYHLIVQLSDN